jgi:putative lipoic acid-binding regulatory protein
MSDSNPFGEARISFPVSFELRIIYTLAEGAALEEQVLAVLHSLRAKPGMPKALPATGSTYGRMAVPVTFASETDMHAAYQAIGALRAVKTLI